jgi:hypothetical protein
MLRFEHEHLELWRVYADNGAFVGEIEWLVKLGHHGWMFTQSDSRIRYTANELRQIADKLDQLNAGEE